MAKSKDKPEPVEKAEEPTYPSPEQEAALAEPPPPPLAEIARGIVVELRGDTHVLLRQATAPGEQIYEIAPHQQVALKTAIAIFEDGSVALVGKPPPEPVEIKLPTEPQHDHS
jgi:hypothetical protein